MSNPLEPVWEAHQTSLHALKVVRRCVLLGSAEQGKPLRNTKFHGMHKEALLKELDRARSEMDDLTVVSLYATFEARLREHVTQQASLLQGAGTPDREFGRALAEDYEGYWDDAKMDKVVKLFAHAVGDGLVAQVGNIRTFRHWVAHGRRRRTTRTPPSVAPLFAYETLTAFLTLARLV